MWKEKWTPFGRHHARAHEPILHDGQVIVAYVPRDDLPVSATTKAGAKPLGRGREYWNRLQAYHMSTGKLSWMAETGTSVHSTSMIAQLSNGKTALLTGRGGGHQPPEEPYGLSMIDASNGESVWDQSIKGYPAAQNANWDRNGVHFFAGDKHFSASSETGEIRENSLLF